MPRAAIDPTPGPAPEPIPVFDLYGEAAGKAEPGFAHLETIRDRARLHDWRIRPHRHGALQQVLFLARGGVRARIDAREHAVTAPALILAPPLSVHGFAFEPDTEGHVLTVSRPFLEQALGLETDGVVAVLERPLVAPIAPGDPALAGLLQAFAALAREFDWPRAGRRRAIAAHLALILVAAARLDGTAAAPPAPGARLLADFQRLIHRHGAQGWRIPAYAEALAVTPARLTAACRRHAGCSPLALVHERLLAEAKRSLLYTAMSVQEIGYALGFADPAYFTRFFTRREGRSPRRYREQATAGWTESEGAYKVRAQPQSRGLG